MSQYISDEQMDELEKAGIATNHNPFEEKYLSDEEMAALESQKPQERKAEAALQGFGNAAGFGYLPHLQAMVETPAAWLTEKVASTDIGSKLLDVPKGAEIEPDDYIKARDGFIKRQETLQKENPTAYGAGSVGGALASGIGMTPLMGARALTTVGNIGKSALQAGALGAAQNPGDTEGESSGLQLGDRLENGLWSGLLGGGLAGATEGISKLGSVAGNFYKKLANEKAVKATGAMKGDFKKMDPKQIQSMGDDLLEERIVTPFARPKDIAERVGKKQTELINQLDETITKADSLGELNMENATPEQIMAYMNLKSTPADLKKAAYDQLKAKFKGVPGSEMESGFKKIDQWLLDQPEQLGARDLQQMKTSMNPFLSTKDFANDNSGMAKEGLKALRSTTKKSIEDKANFAADILGENSGQIKNTNRKLGSMFGAENFAEDAIARDAANRSIGLTDTLLGAGGIAGGLASDQDPTTTGAIGLALAAGNKLSRAYGNPLTATGYKALSNQLLKVPRFAQMAQNNPGAFQSMLTNFINSPKFQKTSAPPLQENNQLMDILGKNPEMIEKIQNPNLREALRKRLQKDGEPEKDPRQSYIQGN